MAPSHSTDRSADGQRSPIASPTKTFLIFGAILAPIAIVPYALIRGQLMGLRKELMDLRTSSKSLAREVRAAANEVSERRAEASTSVLNLLNMNRKQLMENRADLETMNKSIIEESQKGMEGVTARLDAMSAAMKELERNTDTSIKEVKNMVSMSNGVMKEREKSAKAWREQTSKSIEQLVEDRQGDQPLASSPYTEEARALGQALADVAAFMQEVEMRQGWAPRPMDGRGIDKMRQLAKRLDKLAASMDPAKDEAQAQTANSEPTGDSESTSSATSRPSAPPPPRTETTSWLDVFTS